MSDIGARLQRAGSELDQVHGQSTRTQKVLAGGFVNNGAPVYDAQTHSSAMPPGFADSGTRLHDAGRRVVVVALELSSAIDDVNAAQGGLWQLVDSQRRTFAAAVQAAASGPGGLIPEAQVPALQARRANVAAQMQELVNSCGRDVVTRVGQYQTVVVGCQQLLSELGLSTGLASGVRTGFPGARLEGGPTGPEIVGNPVPAPGDSPPNIFPVSPPRAAEPGFTPLPGGFGGPLITLPAPDLGTDVQDGPGSGQRTDSPRIQFDADAAGGNPPAGTGGADEPVGKLGRVDDKFLKRHGVDPHEIKDGNDLRPPSHFDIYVDQKGNMFGVRKGNDPRNGEFLGNLNDQ